MQQTSSSTAQAAHYVTPLNERGPSQPASILRQTPPSTWQTPYVRQRGSSSDTYNINHSASNQLQLPRRPSSRPEGLVLDAAGPGIIRPALSSSSTISQLSMSSALPENTSLQHASGSGRRRARIRTPAEQQQQRQEEKKSGMVNRLYSHMTTTRKKTEAPREDNDQQQAHDTSFSSRATTAAEWARDQAPHAGFLEKLGTHVPVMKRRFFILQPGTHLYYFLSPNDSEPRGCLDLEGSWIEEEAGTTRFSLCWEGGRRVVLEGRTPEMAREWKDALERERLSYCKAALNKERRKNSACISRIQELETIVENFKLVEQDRDGALEDAARWKQRFEQLDESCRQLSMQLRRQAVIEAGDSSNVNKAKEGDHNVMGAEEEEEKKEDATGKGKSSKLKSQTEDTATTTGERQEDGKSGRAGEKLSLFDDADEDDDASIDVVNVPGNHFSSLFNSCQQLRENHRLASVEAASAVEDLTSANGRVVAVEKRMVKAEKHLCKLWEENCSLRKSLKQKKREKTVLVKEVKTLLEEAKARNESDSNALPIATAQDDDIGSDEEKLINELEEEIMSSIRLHEKFLSTGSTSGIRKTPAQVPSQVDAVENENKSMVHQPLSSNAAAKFDASLQQADAPKPTPPVNERPPQRNLLSLFDESFEEEDSQDEKEDSTTALSLSSVAGEAGDLEHEKEIDDDKPPASGSVISFQVGDSSPERPNPVTQLDEDEEDNDADDEQSRLAAFSSPEFSTAVVTSNGPATTKLACPLTDVVSTTTSSTRAEDSQLPSHQHSKTIGELEVYHLTFYSRKIGLQFQKVPPPPTKSKGLLTEAMTSDLAGVTKGGHRTAAELQRIAAFTSGGGEGGSDSSKPEICDVAKPVDAVLVCGFTGFDDSGSNIRPKLGSRLVAFDGVSVEVGRWTFESIRKSIQARSRPLTLSFRDDYLTTEQRQILTRAAREVQSAMLPPQRTIQYKPAAADRRRPSLDSPSVYSALSNETDAVAGSIDERISASRFSQEDDRSDSVGSDYRHSMPHSFSASRSVSSGNGGVGFRSFSEAGSSASMLSAVAPLVSNLLGGRKEPFTPEYLHREPAAVEDTPQHHDFKSELL